MKSRFVPVGLLLLIACSVHAQESAEPLLAKMRKAYSSLKSARVRTESTFRGGPKRVVASSEVLFKAPGLIRIETTGVNGLTAGAFRAYADGKTYTFTGLPGGPVTAPFESTRFSTQLPQCNLETLCLWEWKKQLTTSPGNNMNGSTFKIRREKWNNRDWILLEETAQAQRVRVLYYIDPATSLIWRTVTSRMDQNTPMRETIVKSLETNVPIDAKVFSPPTNKI